MSVFYGLSNWLIAVKAIYEEFMSNNLSIEKHSQSTCVAIACTTKLATDISSKDENVACLLWPRPGAK